MDSGGGGGAAPTGCFKCGRPGHWSRDCPSNPPGSDDLGSNPTGPPNYPKKTFNSVNNFAPKSASTAAEGTKKIRRARPKLTPDLLLSNDGIGHILRHFPRAFKYRGRGHEVSDLGNLLGMYAEWHSRFLPYYSFEQFVHKVEQNGGLRVKRCIRELHERVANGADPTKLHDPPNQEDMSNHDQVTEGVNLEMQHIHDESIITQSLDTDTQNEHFDNTMKEPWMATDHQTSPASAENEPPKDSASAPSSSTGPGLSEEQLARMRASRLKALERAAARAQASQGTS